MLRQLQLRAPMKAIQLKRSLTCNPKQLQPLALVDAVKKEQQAKIQSKPEQNPTQILVKMKMNISNNNKNNKNSRNNLPMGYSNLARMELPIHENQMKYLRQYSVCLNPLEQLQAEQGKMTTRSNNLPMGYSDLSNDQSNSVALVPLDQAQMDNNLKNIGTQKPQSQPQSKMPEQPLRKIPYYNPLRRRSNVDPARVQYIKDRFKERSLDTDAYKPQGKKYVSRTTLHSGRLDKID
ncbi:putative uncharacterized protein DDB_G0271606 [Drosophila innubila]|uniref:putative uncharacterized protein DDB_G0271606 n=1 Tax=Drosophila innubila TaxID=198719 RepID=UPI00148BF43A|nr:putative uncharacterized protein DDB_G0271606 [Drosophila innubila]